MLRAGIAARQHLARQVGKQIRHASAAVPKVLAIRREDYNVWEGRAPLAPSDVKKLTKQGVTVLVQPSNRRAYTMQDYAECGAIIREDINEASLILGVKQIPIDVLIPNKTYSIFSHTIKAQEENMPMLDAMMEKNIRLIDYERMVDDDGQRLVAFGKYAGVAGMIDILHGMGVRLLALGHHTPFLRIGLAHNYRSLGMARQALRDIGYDIALGHVPKSLGPLIFVFTGSGNVSQGAQEIFRELPHEYIEAEHLPKVARQGSMNKVYGCVVSRADHYTAKDGSGYNARDFEQHPDRYLSTFSQTIAPYATCIINGLYFAPNAPRLISIPDAKTLLQPQKFPWIHQSPGCPTLPHRLIALCDISADPGGSIEFMEECTTIDRPFCLYDAEEHRNTESMNGPGVIICSIDQLPAQMPIEATDYFGDKLFPFIHDMLKSDATTPLEEFDAPNSVKGAVITSNGSMAPNYNYIGELRTRHRTRFLASLEAKARLKKVLVLGSGYVSGPVVEYLSRDDTCYIQVASNSRSEAELLTRNLKNAEPHYLNINDGGEAYDAMIKDSDLVISLLPQFFHGDVAKMCIRHKTPMVTASYTSPEMRDLNKAAADAGVTILNEMGLDPGIDHLMAHECFDEIREGGGKVLSYTSYCGGIPSPELTHNPLRYKFSWSPVGVLFNAVRSARYLQDGQVIDVPAGGHVLDHVTSLDFLPGFNFEGIPNRDSLVYQDLYDVKSATTFLRGSIRYKGYVNTMQGLVKLGLIDNTPHPTLHPGGPDLTWKELMCHLVKKPVDIFTDSLRDCLYEMLDKDDTKLQAVEQLGLLEDELVTKKTTPVDTLAEHLNNTLAYGPGERDLVILRNVTHVQWPSHKEVRDDQMVVYGDAGGYSAMAKCVGYTTAIAAKMILEGEIQAHGVIMPSGRSVYRPVLQRLKRLGMDSKRTLLSPD